MKLTRCDLALALAPFRRRGGNAALVVLLFAVACALTSVNGSLFLFLHARPLPYPNYERILWLGQAGKLQRSAAGDQQTLDNFLHLQRELKGVERIAAFNRWHTETLRHGDSVETITGSWIAPGYFEVLGLKPALGTTFSDPTLVGQSPRPLLLSTRLWARSFAGDPGVLHQTVWLNDRPHVIVGVMGEDTLDPGYGRGEQPEFWAPLDPQEVPKPDWKSRWFPTLALLRSGVSPAQFQAELDAATQQLRELYPNLMAERELVAHDLKRWLFGDHGRYFNLLMVTSALLSVLVVINLANLLLAQVGDRAGYFGVARALGAGPGQMLRPLVIEHLLLCALGALASVPLALAYRHLLTTTLERTGLTLPVFDGELFALVVLTLTALVILLLFLGTRSWQREGPRDVTQLGSSRVVASRARTLPGGLALLAQAALAAMLIVVCSVLALSLRRLASANSHLPLADMHRVFIVTRPEKYESHTVLLRRLQEAKAALLALPEVRSATLASPALPSEQSPLYATIDDLDTVPIKESPKRVVRPAVCADFFAATGLRIVAGRGFTEHDLEDNGRRVVVINQRAAELFWPGRDPIGRRVLVNHRTDDWAEVIGVAQNLESPMSNAVIPVVWRSFNHHPYLVTELLFQTQDQQPLTREKLQRTIWSADPELLIVEYGSLAEYLRNWRWLPTAIARLSFMLAIVAGAVCAFGVFSILNRRVTAALKEIAVRKALGAPAWRIVSAVGRSDLVWAFSGIVLGAALALLGLPGLFETKNLTLMELSAAPALAGAAVLAGAFCGALVPALRALATDPVRLLRAEG